MNTNTTHKKHVVDYLSYLLTELASCPVLTDNSMIKILLWTCMLEIGHVEIICSFWRWTFKEEKTGRPVGDRLLRIDLMILRFQDQSSSD